ncbi:MAG: DUF192 domain-containing protein [Candidatus Micrarchaeota archaeon]
MTRVWLAFIFAILFFGCLNYGGNSTSAPPMGSAKVLLPDGKTIDCEVPLDQRGIERGLMYRDSLCESCGMLFNFQTEGKLTFWMKNMKMNIDIVFIGKDWRVVGIALDAPPCGSEPCMIYTPDSNALHVLELPANATIKHEIRIGSEITKIE